MSLIKHGDGQVIPEDGEKKTAAKTWDAKDEEELTKENQKADE